MGALQIVGAVAMFGASMLLSAFLPKPKLKSVKLSAATYGHCRPMTNGNIEIGGNVLWQTDIKLEQDDVGKGAGGGTIIRGKASFMLGFGEGPRNIRQIWADGKLIYDDRPGATKKKKYKAHISIYTGSEEDLPDPYMEAKLGVGLVQAYRGEVHVFLEEFPLEDYGNRAPNFTAEVVEEFGVEHHLSLITEFTQNLAFSDSVMLDPRDDHPLLYATERGVALGAANTTLLAKINAITRDIEYEMPALSSAAPNGIGSDIDNDANIYAEINSSPGFVGLGRFDSSSGTLTGTATTTGGNWSGITGRVIVDRVSNSGWIAHVTGTSVPRQAGTLTLFDQTGLHVLSVTPSPAFGIFGGGSPRRMTDVTFDRDGHVYCLVSDPGTGAVEIWKPDGGGGASLFATISSNFTGHIGLPEYIMWFDQDNSLILGGRGELGKFSIDDLEFVKHLDTPTGTVGFRTFHNAKMLDTVWLPDTVSDSSVTVPPGSLRIFPAFQEIDLLRFEKKRYEVFREAATLYPIPGYTYFNPLNAQFDPDQDVIWSEAFPEQTLGRFSLRGGAACVTLSSVIDQYSVRVGLVPGVDTDTHLLDDDEVCGYYMAERQAGRALIEPLLNAHAVDVYESDKLYFIPRGSASALTIPQRHLASHAPSEQRPLGDLIEIRKEERELPESVDVKFFRQFDYEDGHARAWRSERNVFTTSQMEVEFPEVFSNSRAQKIADRMLYEAWIERTTYGPLTIPPMYMYLTPTDVISTIVNGVLFSMRLTKVDIGVNYVVRCEGVATDTAVYVGITQPPGGVIQPPSGGIPGSSPTHLALIDSPMLRESDNDAGFYVAVAPELQNSDWKGAVVFKSNDGRAYTSFLEDTSAATMGYAETVLPSTDRWTVWDETSTLVVTLFVGEAENFTRLDLLNGKNVWIIGDEICQPSTATMICPPSDPTLITNRWLLGPPWIRARRGTEWALGTHVAGEKVVFLDTTTLRRAFQPLSEVNVLRYYEAISYGDSTDGATAQQFVDTARSLKPFSPMGITATRDMSGNISGSFIRRSRFSAPFAPLMSPILGEESEAYKVRVLNGSTVARTIDTATPAFTYSAANQVSDGITPGNSVTLKIVQISASVGEGFEREATV